VEFRWEAEISVDARGKAAEGRRTPGRWREGYGPRLREASWSAPVPWRFGHGVNRPENISPSRNRQFSSHYSDLTSPSGKAAEGRRTPGRWRGGGARHSVRAAVVNPDAPVGSRRRAGDCAPYRRFAVSAKTASGTWLRSMHESFLTSDFLFFIQYNP